jgi:hypothetical protein
MGSEKVNKKYRKEGRRGKGGGDIFWVSFFEMKITF